MSGAAGKLKGFLIVAGLLLGAPCMASAAQFPIDRAYGTPDACALFRWGGRDSVVGFGTKMENGELVFFESELHEDDAGILVEPTAMSAVDLACTVVGSRGNEVDLDCRELDTVGIDDILTARVTPIETGLRLDWGDKTYLLEPC